jgi:hypothetical protein
MTGPQKTAPKAVSDTTQSKPIRRYLFIKLHICTNKNILQGDYDVPYMSVIK